MSAQSNSLENLIPEYFKDFIWNNVKNFSLITSNNGIGKSKLLKLIRYRLNKSCLSKINVEFSDLKKLEKFEILYTTDNSEISKPISSNQSVTQSNASHFITQNTNELKCHLIHFDGNFHDLKGEKYDENKRNTEADHKEIHFFKVQNDEISDDVKLFQIKELKVIFENSIKIVDQEDQDNNKFKILNFDVLGDNIKNVILLKIENGRLKLEIEKCKDKIEFSKLIHNELSSNLINVNLPFKIIFVEGNDAGFYNKFLSFLLKNNPDFLKTNIQLIFKPLGYNNKEQQQNKKSSENDSSCTKIEGLLRKIGNNDTDLNPLIFGIIDEDNQTDESKIDKKKSIKNLNILDRYEKENYILDPLYVLLINRMHNGLKDMKVDENIKLKRINDLNSLLEKNEDQLNELLKKFQNYIKKEIKKLIQLIDESKLLKEIYERINLNSDYHYYFFPNDDKKESSATSNPSNVNQQEIDSSTTFNNSTVNQQEIQDKQVENSKGLEVLRIIYKLDKSFNVQNNDYSNLNINLNNFKHKYECIQKSRKTFKEPKPKENLDENQIFVPQDIYNIFSKLFEVGVS
ncbi:hypothetical protein BpHYR1_040946 [Brachionus plicatilis]|uniref:Uncharacterized protein n=1 Tax=Brachionus plicatilis TaxID=10195 RepID=A0A3M7TC60_BRAPC|nr:hypothetical protein BpHYR1_040946 [Brachionus plicatilis]